MTDPPTDEPAARTGRRAYLLGVLAAVVALAVGVAIGLLVPESRPGDGSAEAGFARDMQTHHAQAVEMSMIAYRRSADPEIQTIGLDVALTQQAQIGMMRDWLDQWQLAPTGRGIMMAKEVLRRTDRAEVRSLAESMKTGQQNEITAFTAVLARNGAKPS